MVPVHRVRRLGSQPGTLCKVGITVSRQISDTRSVASIELADRLVPEAHAAETITLQSASAFRRMNEDGNPKGLPNDNLTRTVTILERNPTAVGNSVRTSLYTWYTFPTIGVLELLYPWSKFANFCASAGAQYLHCSGP